MTTPEQLARLKIDGLLKAAGWVVQDMADFNKSAAMGVAVREFQLPAGPCDYLLFIDGKAAGVIEAKKMGVTLTGVSDQSEKYMNKLPDIARWSDNLLFDYESTGVETLFRDMRDPEPRSRHVFAFHKPETLHAWLQEDTTLRGRLAHMPELDKTGLRDCQIDAITGLEASLAKDKPRSLIQMATGAGKTFTACSFSYRLLKYAKAKRILFLVDRKNLGNQTLREFQNFTPPGTAHKFNELYITQQQDSNAISPSSKVVITTIQRLYAMLRGEELAEDADDVSAFETSSPVVDEESQKPIEYNPAVPIELFDFVITDECHRSIYGLWRQVLDYFDAHIIGLTATPTKHTLGFFQQNLVAEYPFERSVADGVNVDFDIFRIRTQVGEQGGKVEAGYQVGVMDKRTRKQRYEKLDSDLEYTSKELDRSVTVPNQIRTVIQAYADNVFTTLFAYRKPDASGVQHVPKTLIFAKDDAHADQIVQIVREVFGKGNDFAKKITYRTSEAPQELIKTFRNDYNPRVAVTVDMIATGTDVKPIEVLIFMRDVKSEGYFEQMKGRGVRSINADALRNVTPDAEAKTRFILIDAVGVTESLKTTSQPLERKKGVGFDKLLGQVAAGKTDADTVSSLAGRLAGLERRASVEDMAEFLAITNGLSLSDLSNTLLDALDPDKIEAAAAASGATGDGKAVAKIEEKLRQEACKPFDNPKLRQALIDLKSRTDIVIDHITTDTVLTAVVDNTKAEKTIKSFQEFIEKHKDSILALQLIYSRPARGQHITYAAIKELRDTLVKPPWALDLATIWRAYQKLQSDKVSGANVERTLTDIISLVRYATGQTENLEPFKTQVIQRFNLWMGRQLKAGRTFTEEQAQWLKLIADHIAVNAEVTTDDFKDMPSFADRGGLLKARKVFGAEMNDTLDDMTQALVA
jgi:type I restriction enzyme R subunit